MPPMLVQSRLTIPVGAVTSVVGLIYGARPRGRGVDMGHHLDSVVEVMPYAVSGVTPAGL